MVSEVLVLNQFEEANKSYTKLLQPKQVGDTWEIEGCIDVVDDEGSLWDTYNIKIIVPDKFPEQLFELQETGNKIPKVPEWHNNDFCCLSTNAVMFSEMVGNITLLNWLDKFVFIQDILTPHSG